MPLRDHTFAVVDCETTGLFPGAHHRIIELAVLQVEATGELKTEWHTLLNPKRDLGDTATHGIRGTDVANAPGFEDIVGVILELIAGRVVVAHNARFDIAFLEAELARCGYDLGPLPGLCTIAMAQRVGLRARRLPDCCQELGIQAEPDHQALNDARACAGVFLSLVRQIDAAPLASFNCPEPADHWPSGPVRARPCPRNGRASKRQTDSFLARLASARAGAASEPSTDTSGYLELLDRALEDRRLSKEECADLEQAARLYGLSGEQIIGVHSDYLDELCRAALDDHVVTRREHEDLQLVAELLGLGDLETRLEASRSRAAPHGAPGSTAEDLTGKSVCFTGKLLCSVDGEPLTRERAQGLAEEAGLSVARTVTKKLDILVVADPHSLSGKAKKARQYGTRIISEAAFWPMIGVRVE